MFSKDKSKRLKQIEGALKHNKNLTEKGRATLEKMRAELLESGVEISNVMNSAKFSKKEKKNKFGIKKGDVFVSSWGYDATFHDFYEVTDVMGESRVKVKELQKTAGKGSGAGPCCWTVRPLKNTYADDEELVRSVGNYSANKEKASCYIKDKYKYNHAYYTENPFDRDWEEDNYH